MCYPVIEDNIYPERGRDTMMGATQQFAYQYFIVPIMAGAVIALLYCLLHEGKKRLLSGILSAVCGIVVVWYFLPFHIHIDPVELPVLPGEVRIFQGDRTVVPTWEQTLELVELCNELVYVRRPGELGSIYDGKDGVTVWLYSGGFHLQVLLTFREDGFLYWTGVRAVNHRYDRVQNPEELIAYLKILLAEE